MTEFTTWRSLVDGAEISVIPDSGVGQNSIAIWNFADDDDTSILSDQIGDFDGDIRGMDYVDDDDAGRTVGHFDGVDDDVIGMGLPTFAEYSIGLIIKPINSEDLDTYMAFRENNTMDLRKRNGDWQVTQDDGEDFKTMDIEPVVDDTYQTIVIRWDGSTQFASVNSIDNQVSQSMTEMDVRGESDHFGDTVDQDRPAECKFALVEVSDQDEGESFESDFHDLI